MTLTVDPLGRAMAAVYDRRGRVPEETVGQWAGTGFTRPVRVTDHDYDAEYSLVDVVPGQPVRVGDPDPVEFSQCGEVAEFVQAGSPERRPGVPVVPEDVVLRERPRAVSGDPP
ncbi:MAG TPA: hypothetical protein VH092_07545 [Urbifossiella sp.]|nr:hypothetical protein [Urbifossiella sp.]